MEATLVRTSASSVSETDADNFFRERKLTLIMKGKPHQTIRVLLGDDHIGIFSLENMKLKRHY